MNHIKTIFTTKKPLIMIVYVLLLIRSWSLKEDFTKKEIKKKGLKKDKIDLNLRNYYNKVMKSR